MTTFSHRDYRVAFTTVDVDVQVSTVWLREGEFETLVFGGERNGLCRRYTTEAEAREGHAAICAEVTA